MVSIRKKTAGPAAWPVKAGKTTLVTARGFASVAETPDDPPDQTTSNCSRRRKKPGSRRGRVIVKPTGEVATDPGQVKCWVEGLIRQALGPCLAAAERKTRSKLNLVLDPRTHSLLTCALRPVRPGRSQR